MKSFFTYFLFITSILFGCQNLLAQSRQSDSLKNKQIKVEKELELNQLTNNYV